MALFAMLSRRGIEISTPKKIAIGMGLAGLAFLFLAIFSAVSGYPSATEFRAMPVEASASMLAGPWVLILLYFFLTVAELFISPLGLSFVSKVARLTCRVSVRVYGSALPLSVTSSFGLAR